MLKADAKKEAYEREGVQRIQWLHLGGGKTDRADHIAFASEPPHLFEQEPYFTDSGGQLLYPHDPAGSAEDIINCYCDYIPVPQEA